MSREEKQIFEMMCSRTITQEDGKRLIEDAKNSEEVLKPSRRNFEFRILL